MWIIEDWACNRIRPDLTFETFDEGWAHIYETHPNEEDLGDYYVTEMGGF